jgi:sulfite exporter TauE/SafE
MAALGGATLAAVSSVHCVAMCGPLAAASQARGGSGASTRYLLGRAVSYSLMGSLAGGLGEAMLTTRWARWAEAALAWALALALLHTALGFFGLWRSSGLIKLGRGPRRSRFAALLVHVADDPLLLGAATALLPCGALYSALLGSAALGQSGYGSLFMASFALVTTPAVLGGAQLARLAQLGERGRRALGAVLLAGALLTALRPLSVLSAEPASSCPLHAQHAGSP